MQPPIPPSSPSRFAKAFSPGRRKSCTWTTFAPNEDWNVQLETSQDDPLLGESYVQFAWKGLQHQLSQGAGGWTAHRRPPHQLLQADRLRLAGNARQRRARKRFLRRDRYFATGACGRGWARIARKFLAAVATGRDRETGGRSHRRCRQESRRRPASRCLADSTRLAKLIAKSRSLKLSAVEKADLLVDLRTKQQQFEQAANLALLAGPRHWSRHSGRPSHGRRVRHLRTAKCWPRSSQQASRFCCLRNFTMAAQRPWPSRSSTSMFRQGWNSELFMDKVPSRIRSRRGLRADVSSVAAGQRAAHQGVLPSWRSGDGLRSTPSISRNT